MYTYSLNEIMPLKMIMLHLRAIENLKNSSLRVVGRGSPEDFLKQ